MENQPMSFYANAVNFSASIYDVTLGFKSQSPQIDQNGNVMEYNDKPKISVVDEIIVRMSPQHAKALAGLLVDSIKDYEKKFDIKLPLEPNIENIWDKHIK